MKTIRIGDKTYGESPIIIAGPCAVESFEQSLDIADSIKDFTHMLRGGAFKPRTDPKTFQGLGEEGLRILSKIKEETKLPLVTEIMDKEHLDIFVDYDVDVYQIGARNMHNSFLLKSIGKKLQERKAVILKRGFAATKEEVIGAIGYLEEGGVPKDKIMICERGIRTFADYSRFTFDINFVIDSVKDSNMPLVIADPSHAVGRHEMVEPLSYAAIAAGARGLMIELMQENGDRSKLLSDAQQAIRPSELKRIVENVNRVWKIL